ncbi:unnamed protein product [Rhodiola kirilowii]
MPLGKYYCDYCDKEFQDTQYARKRHLQGLQHQRARSIWYNSFKGCRFLPITHPFGLSISTFIRLLLLAADPSQLSSDGFGTGVCNRFVKTGFCPYGDACKYLHPKIDNFPGQRPPPVTGSAGAGSNMYGGGSFQGTGVGGSLGIPWGNLPPSLKPPPEGGYPPLPFVDWG